MIPSREMEPSLTPLIIPTQISSNVYAMEINSTCSQQRKRVFPLELDVSAFPSGMAPFARSLVSVPNVGSAMGDYGLC